MPACRSTHRATRWHIRCFARMLGCRRQRDGQHRHPVGVSCLAVVLGGFLRRCGLWAQPPKSLESQNLTPLLMRDLQPCRRRRHHRMTVPVAPGHRRLLPPPPPQPHRLHLTTLALLLLGAWPWCLEAQPRQGRHRLRSSSQSRRRRRCLLEWRRSRRPSSSTVSPAGGRRWPPMAL